MRDAYRGRPLLASPAIDDLRTAAFAAALEKVVRPDRETGLA